MPNSWFVHMGKTPFVTNDLKLSYDLSNKVIHINPPCVFFSILERPIFRADTRSKAVGDAWNSEAKDLGLGPRGVEELGGNSPRVMGVCLKNMTKR